MFSEAKARRVTQFIECLKHTKGEFHGEPFKLLPWQEQIIRDAFITLFSYHDVKFPDWTSIEFLLIEIT